MGSPVSRRQSLANARCASDGAAGKSAGPPSRASDSPSRRPITPLPLGPLKPADLPVDRPRFVDVDPRRLVVETAYQRDLSASSMRLISTIVEQFDWAKFKPPICVEEAGGYLVVDGQHTAIAAATHPDIATIPVMLVEAASIASRAQSFVAHNRDRVAMSSYQVFHGEVAAGEAAAVAIERAVRAAGGEIPRRSPVRGHYRVGQATAIRELRAIYGVGGGALVRRVYSVAVEARCRPVTRTVLRAIRILLTAPEYGDVDRDDLVTALLERPDIDDRAQRYGAETGQGRDTAAAVILYRACLRHAEAGR